VKLPDANVLLYALDETSPHYEISHTWAEAAFSGSETIALAWSVLLAVIRLSTNPTIFQGPLTPDEALDLIDSWLAQPCTTIIHPTQRHAAVLRELLAPLGVAGNLASDAHLAALAIEHGAELCSFDSDFSRFAGVRWVNLLKH